MQKDPVLAYLFKQASEKNEIERLILFGSRATGTASERSDYDFAVSAPSFDHENWSAWAQTVRQQIPTLCGIDLVWIESISNTEIETKIVVEGKVFYERSESVENFQKSLKNLQRSLSVASPFLKIWRSW